MYNTYNYVWNAGEFLLVLWVKEGLVSILQDATLVVTMMHFQLTPTKPLAQEERQVHEHKMEEI